ncbi:MAG: DUF2325 domain-containing protein [Gammaproteobacteria bacterium]|nr:DUF2325 domain-containing protein [Gammaproteobacteria bacterium]
MSIWDLPIHNCCPIIGTCLDIKQLKRIKQRFGKELQGVQQLDTDYDLHSYFVAISSSKNPISIYINKILKKKYQRFVSDIKKHTSEAAIEALWSDIPATNLNSLAGYFWAIVSSEHVSEALKKRVFGEIHMISHIAGQSNITTTQSLLDDKHQALQEVVKKNRLLESKNRQLEDLRHQLNELRLRNVKISKRNSSIEKENALTGVSTQDNRFQEQKIYQLQQHINQLGDKLQTRNNPAVLLSNLYKPEKNKPEQKKIKNCDNNCSECKRVDLCGKKILYVGGFSRHRKKFQQITHSCNGEFYYHDGGMQQSTHLLNSLIKKADCIFFPIDCVSHGAMGRIKSLAKTHCKDCVFLRSASLSSFDHEIRRYAS